MKTWLVKWSREDRLASKYKIKKGQFEIEASNILEAIEKAATIVGSHYDIESVAVKKT